MIRFLIVCGLVAPVIRLGLIVTLGALHPTYSQATDFISELGAPDSPYADVMNYVGISLVGLLLAGFSVPLWQAAPDSVGKAGAALLFLSGISFVVVGLAPCDRPGCGPGGSADVMFVHMVSGFTGMTTQALAPIAFGLGLFRAGEGRVYSAASLLLGLVSIMGLVALITGQGMPGLAQKTMQVAADGWVFGSAAFLYFGADRFSSRSNARGDARRGVGAGSRKT